APGPDRCFLAGWGELGPGGEGRRGAVGGAEVVPHPGRKGLAPDTADAGAEDDVFLLEPQLVDGLEQPVLDHADPAAVTGLGRNLTRPEVLLCQFVHHLTSVHSSEGASTAPSETSPTNRLRRQSRRSHGDLAWPSWHSAIT